ncbi:T9SS type A sorting domain-containing protein [Flavihumibacter petaseus]|uniref:Secretion system C-terminal sorting domain-containing protein n=1 Tax=Flavihumibacter petaseus NBRC 106054 TaxID=1220578 RepID=A0A0E9MW59_9BACT|nr:T9SS type A sorting domain-containing protein [Flavihumibacter petaseus]GAO41661.1 hypothetical protein FPE01S_01_06750 [Flavihumibacter petaseus NBRC 106054]
MNNRYATAFAVALKIIVCCCLLTWHISASAQVTNGYSYVNITKQTVGGTVEPGDVLEIRHSIHIPWGFNSANSGRIYNVRYYDSLPTRTTMVTTAMGGSLRVITNEGVTLAGKSYTTTAGDDAGTYIANPAGGEYHIRINLGSAPTAPANNKVSGTGSLTGASSINVSSQGAGDAPKWYTGHLFSTAFRVTVTGTYGQVIDLGAARFYYTTTSNSTVSIPIPVYRYKILIAKNDALCTNTVGANFAGESGGTFGSGNSLNRSTGPSYAISGYTYVNNVSASNAVNDGSYAIVNNLSPRGSNNTAAKKEPNCNSSSPATTTANNCNNRMFSVWDIAGDHSGTATTGGNVPPASGANSGYMLMVNSDYVTSEAYRQTISGLCPGTTYEFSAWIKNICSYCGMDATLNARTGAGVKPSLTFVLDGIDRYGTGEIAYTGNWIKKGFTFTTGASQTSVTFSIRNNAQGGGGNDWVMDDISIATCQPNLVMKPYGNASVCYGNQVSFSADIQSVFSNYSSYRWERSTDGGTTWSNQSNSTGTPALVGGQYTYTVNFPPIIGDENTHNDIIRLRVATTSDNLNNNSCSFLASTQVVVLVHNCEWVLSADIVQFKAQPGASGTSLRWATVNESEGLVYVLEKSTDQRNWTMVREVNAKVNGAQNNYSELDPSPLNKPTYYRISMVYNGKQKFTHQLLVQPGLVPGSDLVLQAIQNPFNSQLPFDLYTPVSGEANIALYDLYGKQVKQLDWKLQRGGNKLVLANTSSLASGTYILMIRMGDKLVQRKVIKANR